MLRLPHCDSVDWLARLQLVTRPPWEIGDDEIVDRGLSIEERELLWEGLHQWGGPARPTDALARVLGFSSADRMHREMDPIRERLKAGEPLTKHDWERALVATEICFASNFYGAGNTWEIASGWDDERTLRVLRAIQGKLAGFRAPPRHRQRRSPQMPGEPRPGAASVEERRSVEACEHGWPMGALGGDLCPVCGFDGLDEPAWVENSPSDDICPCCGVQFGYDDMRRDASEREARHAELRGGWVSEGCRWWSSSRQAPPAWDPRSQLERAGHDVPNIIPAPASRPPTDRSKPTPPDRGVELDYEDTLAQLVALVGRDVTVTVRRVNESPPLANLVGTLQGGIAAPFPGGEREQVFFSMIDRSLSGFVLERESFVIGRLLDWQGSANGRSLDIQLGEAHITVDWSWRSSPP